MLAAIALAAVGGSVLRYALSDEVPWAAEAAPLLLIAWSASSVT